MVHQLASVDGFVAKYEPAIAAHLKTVRAHLSSRFSRGFELVYDNYNALVFGFGPTERASDALVSVAAYPKWVTLFFLKGAGLPDPGKVLQGSGSQVRSVRLMPLSVLHSQEVQTLLDRVMGEAEPFLALAPPLSTLVKSISAKQRPRRPPAPRRPALAGKRGGA